MPAFLEAKLRKSFDAQKAKGKLKGVDEDKYVYGGMNSMGAMRGNKITKKGRRMQAKHDRKISGKLSEMV